MNQAVDSLLTSYETGRLSRRDLVLTLAALAAAPAAVQAQAPVFCFGLADFDPAATVKALEAQGIAAENRVRDGVAQVYCADPDNLRVQLQDVSFCGGVGALGNECR